MAPGVLSQRRLMGNAALLNHVQPVRLITPNESNVAVIDGTGGSIEAGSSAVTVGMSAGLVYRFRVDFVDVETPVTVYPSVELLDRLYPPAGLENQFPVPIVITRSDLDNVKTGGMVTKVIYLEDATSTLDRQPLETDQPSIDVDGGDDPLHVAHSLGRPMALLRIGTRVPLASELSGPSAFDSSVPTILPDPVEVLPATAAKSLQREAATSATLSDGP